MVAEFPRPDAQRSAPEAEQQMQRLMQLVTEIRTIRASYEVKPSRRIDVTLVAADAADRGFFTEHAGLVRALAGLQTLDVVADAAELPGTIKQPVLGMEVRIPMAGLFDIAEEMTRLSRERVKLESELASLLGRLENPQFVSRAKPEVVAENRARVLELRQKKQRLETTLAGLKGGAHA